MVLMHRKYTVLLLGLLVLSAPAWAVDERVKEIRDGNRQFDKSRYRKAELEYRRALVKDSTSVDASYNLANTLYRMEDYEQAMKVMQGVSKGADESEYKGDFNYNMGNVCVARKDWGPAVEAYKKALLENPGDVDAKENYLYAKAMYDEQQKQQQNQDQNQNQNQNKDNQNQNKDQQNQNKDQNQNQDQNQDQNKQDRNQQNQDQQDQQSPQNQEQQVSPQAAQQMLQAIQEKEKQTQEKVEKEKAALVGKKKREKNW